MRISEMFYLKNTNSKFLAQPTASEESVFNGYFSESVGLNDNQGFITSKYSYQYVIPSGKYGVDDKGLYYEVKSGDNLSAIASRLGLTISQLRALNPGMDIDNLSIGQKIYFNGEMYKIKQGDTLSQIAEQYGVTVEDLKKWNNLINNNIKAGEHLLIVKIEENSVEQNTGKTATPEASYASTDTSESNNGSSYIVYTVVSGDTLSGIAQRYGVPQSAIEEANPNLTSPYKLSIGQQIKIPVVAEENDSAEVDNAKSSELSVPSNEIVGLYDEVYDLVPEEYESYISQIADNAGVSEDLVRMFIINEGQVCNTGEHRGEKVASLKAYRRNGDVWTIGFGHTNLCRKMDFKVGEGVEITLEEAFQLLEDDIKEMKKYARSSVGAENFDNAPESIQALFIEYCFQNGPGGKLKSANLKANLENGYMEAIAAGSLFDSGYSRRSAYRFMLAISDFTLEEKQKALQMLKSKGYYDRILATLTGNEKQMFINFCEKIA